MAYVVNNLDTLQKELDLTKQKLEEQTIKNQMLKEELIQNERITQNVIGYLLSETAHGEHLKLCLTQSQRELSHMKQHLQRIKENLESLI
jgi:hypothetical protein